ALLGAAPSIGDSAALKRLLFEAQALTIQSLKNAVEAPGTESSTPKRIPQAEKEARLAALRARITGLIIEGVNEPAISLFEQTQHQYEQKTVKYLPPERCPSREFEIVQMKPVKQLVVHGGSVMVGETLAMPDTTVNSSLLVQQALIRRAFPYEFSDLISFQISQKYIGTLFRHMSREAPPGYRQVTLQKADKAVFAKLAELGPAIRRNAAGDRPLDVKIMEALQSYEVSFYLFPLAIPEKPSRQDWKEFPYWHNRLKGQRVHARRGQQFINNRRIFAAREESQYPAGLCSAVAQIVLQICQEYGIVLPPSSMEVAATEQFRLLQQAKTMSHAFVRTKLPPLVPEYATVISAWHAPTTAEDDHGLAIMVPKQARLLQRPLVDWFKMWINRAKELQPQEDELHRSFDRGAKKVMSGKRVLLFREMLEYSGYPDCKAADFLMHGVPLVGEVEESGVYAEVYKPAELSVSTLEEQSTGSAKESLKGLARRAMPFVMTSFGKRP
ncbi:unnamed protein product, partial [Durusdinium trenchii]